MGVPIRKKEVFHPREIIKTPKGETVIDFGQNLAGIARMKVIGERGTEIVLSHGETLDKDGNFTMENITKDQKPRFQEDHYILKGQGVEEFEPRFTVHGFRYVKVDGYPGQLSPEDFSAIAIYSDMESTGTFNCSNPQLNQLHQNVVWSMKGNFLDIPTDCPQRERAGWVGDAQIFAPSAAFLMDTRAFFGKWLKELSLEQYPDGMVGNFVPNPHKLVKSGTVALAKLIDGAAGWADAAVLVPWSQYQAFGDVQVLENQYASMKAWVDFVERKTHKTNVSTALNPRYWLDADFRRRVKLLWDTGYHWGEWLEPGQDLIRGGLFLGLLKRLLKNEIFGVSVVSTAYFANSTRILSQTATLLGKTKDAEKYRTLTEKVKAAYVETYIAEDGRIEPDRQSSYVRVLAFDLAPEKLKPAIVENLVRLIRAAGKHVGTGFLSTVFLCEVLAEYGHLELAYELLNQETNPSWLYAIKKGATTIWEKWDAVAEDGTATSSLNHYSPGAVVNYLHRKVAGIEAIEPGYKRFSIHPMPGGGLTSAKASYESVHGLISSEWEKENGVMRLNVTIPANTRAVITLPKAVLGQVTESGAPVSGADRITNAVQVDSNCQIELGSGNYYFEYPID
jgi:alpha-L-rhamnosidase